MKLKKYIEQLKNFANENPESLEFEVVLMVDQHAQEDYASNEEHEPIMGCLRDGKNRFTSEEDFECYDEDMTNNAVCLNY